jgi:DNA-binding transcriptional regulator YiaG
MKKLLDPSAQRAVPKSAHANGAQKAGRKHLLQAVFQGGAGAISVKGLASRYGISYDTLTRMTGFSLRAVSNWSQGTKPSSSTARRLTEIKRLFAALEKLVSPEAIGPWLKDPNSAFDGSTPLQVIERGETDRVWRMVYELESGEAA